MPMVEGTPVIHSQHRFSGGWGEGDTDSGTCARKIYLREAVMYACRSKRIRGLRVRVGILVDILTVCAECHPAHHQPPHHRGLESVARRPVKVCKPRAAVIEGPSVPDTQCAETTSPTCCLSQTARNRVPCSL